jgi:hypothetical protein
VLNYFTRALQDRILLQLFPRGGDGLREFNVRDKIPPGRAIAVGVIIQARQLPITSER